ncbi:tyrosine-protein kinase transmembrane receptor Ror2-like isoform X2 [Hydractinia symbiolongicarpus]|uniref:tyrosine-protein kinase transmembrane receptor Ror2-like isoform X2 n=1 Tax=Hydractinia symbiolongicarpus TaxID=13093 RepID=UPI00254E5CC9|nr:tyrosine-protein kinase transmembrane receptor Ror2-like isoform X2 [Hydractinia symbiolongicarpus]
MNRLASCVFLLIGTTFSDTILTKAYEDIHEVKCRNYKDILPNGACMKYLSKYKIYQSISRSKSENKDLEQLVIFRFVVKNPTKPYFRRLLGLYYEYASLSPCSNVQAFNRLFDAFGVYVKTLITKHWDCVEIIIQLLCFVRHPTCLQSVIDNKTIISPPCLRNCKNNKCFILMLEILEKLQSFHEICPRKASDQSFYINMTQCFPLPHEDMNNIERCQLLRFTQGKRNFTTNCFQDNGGSYNGSVNVTITGKTCMPWSINPFLSSPVYSDLQSNFCRNPQGYARAPWCYVNETSRHWEYCNIPECVLDVGEQCPYSTCDIEHPGKTTELIVQFQESYL